MNIIFESTTELLQKRQQEIDRAVNELLKRNNFSSLIDLKSHGYDLSISSHDAPTMKDVLSHTMHTEYIIQIYQVVDQMTLLINSEIKVV